MAKLNVNKWQVARRGPRYSPVMQFYLRMIRMALFEALRVKDVPCPYLASTAPDQGLCVFQYRDANCGYAGPLKTCDKTFRGSDGCRTHGNELRYGGFPSMASGVYVPSAQETRLWDEAIMARDWIARAAPDRRQDREGWLLSFDGACEALGLNADHERLWMLEKVDAVADFDTEEVWARIEFLTANPPDESVEPLFDAPRVVPALDQGCLFDMSRAA